MKKRTFEELRLEYLNNETETLLKQKHREACRAFTDFSEFAGTDMLTIMEAAVNLEKENKELAVQKERLEAALMWFLGQNLYTTLRFLRENYEEDQIGDLVREIESEIEEQVEQYEDEDDDDDDFDDDEDEDDDEKSEICNCTFCCTGAEIEKFISDLMRNGKNSPNVIEVESLKSEPLNIDPFWDLLASLRNS